MNPIIVPARQLSPARKQRLILAMTYAYEMSRKSPKPECHKWDARVQKLMAMESAIPWEHLWCTEGLMALYQDMLECPEYYANPLRPVGISDWLWSGLGNSRAPAQPPTK